MIFNIKVITPAYIDQQEKESLELEIDSSLKSILSTYGEIFVKIQ